MKAIWNGQTIAESSETVVVEGNHYFPPESVKPDFLIDSSTTTKCGWKGLANYKTLSVDGVENVDAAWYYASPLPAAQEIAGRLAFWKGVRIED